MARNGAGTYSLPSGNPVVTGTVISSTTMNSTLNDIATALTASIANDGQTVPVANIPMGGFKLTGLGAATVNGDAVRYQEAVLAGADAKITSMTALTAPTVATNPMRATDIQAQLVTAFTTAGTSTAFTLTPTPAITANTTNQRFRVKFNAAAGATPTLAVSGQTAKNLKYYDSSGTKQAITSTQVPLNWISDVEYDGTDWVVLQPVGVMTATVGGTVPTPPNNTTTFLRGDGTFAAPTAAGITLGTPVASTSGTSIDFTGIPSTAKRITISFNGVSTNGISPPMIQIGDSGGIETTGYLGASGAVGATTSGTNRTTGFGTESGVAANVLHGSFILSLENASTNTWVCQGVIAQSNSAYINLSAGSKALSPGPLDRIRVTTIGGTDTFDAGEINISYE